MTQILSVSVVYAAKYLFSGKRRFIFSWKKFSKSTNYHKQRWLDENIPTVHQFTSVWIVEATLSNFECLHCLLITIFVRKWAGPALRAN